MTGPEFEAWARIRLAEFVRFEPDLDQTVKEWIGDLEMFLYTLPDSLCEDEA